VRLRPPDFFAVDLRPLDFFAVRFRPLDFFAVDLRPLDFFAVDLRPLDFFAARFRPPDFFAVDLRPDFFAVDFFAVRFRPDFFAVFVRPSALRSLFTVRAAISFARFVPTPRSFSESLMCSYCLSSLSLHPAGIAPLPLSDCQCEHQRYTQITGTFAVVALE
jgi:hypothetical protein